MSTTGKVSRRMVALVEAFDDASENYAVHGGTLADYETAREALMQGIATLEAIRDVAVTHFGDTLEQAETQGLGMLDNRFLDAMQPFVPGQPSSAAPADERPAFNNDPSYSNKVEDSLIASRPQTLGEETPAEITIAITAAHSRVQQYRVNGWRPWPNEVAIVWLAEERARLVEALEQKEQGLLKVTADRERYWSKSQDLCAQVKDLQSTAARQQEELEQAMAWKGIADNYYERLLRATQSPSSGA